MTDRPYRPELPGLLIEDAVCAALQEDLGRAGDLTTAATIAPDRKATATFNARDGGVICGLPMAKEAFRLMDPDISFEQLAHDGDRVEPGTAIARVSGKARAILSAERTALNYLMHLSGIATATSIYVDAIEGSAARVCCTRKTVPGLRAFQKYAVRCGGGANHRFGLDDAVLIKDNHIAVAGGLTAAIERARSYVGHLVCIEIEVDTLDQLAEALTAGADVILLDNMGPQTLEKAVRMKNETRPSTRLEASGGISIETIATIAATGVDLISTSKITMAASPLDIGLDIQIGA